MSVKNDFTAADSPISLDSAVHEFPEFDGVQSYDFTTVHHGIFDAALWKILRQKVLDRHQQIDVWLSAPAQHLIQDPTTNTFVAGMANMRDYVQKYLNVEPVSVKNDFTAADSPISLDSAVHEFPEFDGVQSYDFTTVHHGIFDAALWKILRQKVLDRHQQIDVWLSAPAQHQVKWDYQYDTVVIGFGGAGATAARFAADAHAKVLLTDAAPNGHEGGNTRYSAQLVGTVDIFDEGKKYYQILPAPMQLDDSMVDTFVAGMANMRDYVQKYLNVEPVSVKNDFTAADSPIQHAPKNESG
ncbi:hypothetical protein WP50_17650 [Lactiplantibacillus plantarum]|nr:hypothetical protein WP50_17650 [Lactiplantibacillus plantarum]